MAGTTIEIRPAHYGTGVPDYRVIAFAAYEHKCAICGYNKYEEVLEVHHKDGDRTNAAVENLELLCPTCHTENHFVNKTGVYSIKIGPLV